MNDSNARAWNREILHASGRIHRAMVYLRDVPSESSLSCCTVPFPKVFSPNNIALLLSWSAPARISAAEADPPSTNTAIFTSSEKISKITPIHKSESKSLLDNYRPISVPPVLSKVS